MTDMERTAFEEWFEAEIKPKPNGTAIELMTKEIAFAGWQARPSRPVVVTDEMALQGAWGPINEFAKRVGLQPFDPRMAPDINEIERVRLILSAALNGGM